MPYKYQMYDILAEPLLSVVAPSELLVTYHLMFFIGLDTNIRILFKIFRRFLRYLENLMIFSKKLWYLEFCYEKSTEIMFSYEATSMIIGAWTFQWQKFKHISTNGPDVIRISSILHL